VEKTCTNCGKVLPRDDARFCNNCGQVIPYSRPLKHSLPGEPPAWMKQLEDSLSQATPSGKLKIHVSDTSTSSARNQTQSSMISEAVEMKAAPEDPKPPHPQETSLHGDISVGNAETDISPPEVQVKPINIPPRELRVKVWNQEEADDFPMQEGIGLVEDLPTRPLHVPDTPGNIKHPFSTSDYTVESVDDEGIVEDLPTRPVIASLPKTPPILGSSTPPAVNNVGVLHLNEVEEFDTRPLMVQRQAQTNSPAVENLVEQHLQATRAPVEPAHSPVVQDPVTPALFPQPQKAPAKALGQTPPVSVAVPPVARNKRKSRKHLLFVLILLIILVGGVSVWLIVFQPFTVPEVTKTTQIFQNSNLGVSLYYPQNWKAEVDQINGIIYFYDDNHTDQVSISAVAASSQTIEQYISRQVSSAGMTGQNVEASLSFAGTSWQQVRGNMLQSGASYTAVLLVTMHGGRYYSILQVAPLATYTQEDQLVFSDIRSSFQFI
jgi:zinc-ribbon domain